MHRRAKRRSLNISRPDRNPNARRDFDQLDNRNGYAISRSGREKAGDARAADLKVRDHAGPGETNLPNKVRARARDSGSKRLLIIASVPTSRASGKMLLARMCETRHISAYGL